MKVKTSELSGKVLDWSVAKCEGLLDQWGVCAPIGYRPSTDWTQGGPIIERETIKTGVIDNSTPVIWAAQLSDPFRIKPSVYSCIGPTPLISAMRCYVASKLGDVVDIPDNMVS